MLGLVAIEDMMIYAVIIGDSNDRSYLLYIVRFLNENVISVILNLRHIVMNNFKRLSGNNIEYTLILVDKGYLARIIFSNIQYKLIIYL